MIFDDYKRFDKFVQLKTIEEQNKWTEYYILWQGFKEKKGCMNLGLINLHFLDLGCYNDPYTFPELFKAGIYIIRNIITSKRYVGSSTCIYDRAKEHLSQLKKGTHHNAFLQKDFVRYGSLGFNLEIMDYIEEDETLQELRERVTLNKK